MGFRDEVISNGVTSISQLLGHAVRTQGPGRVDQHDVDRARHEEALSHADQVLERHRQQVAAETPAEKLRAADRIPRDLFEPVEGHEPIKRILRRALEAEKPVHVLLVGPPGSGKTQLLQALARLPNSRYATGPTISTSGLFSYLLDHPECRILIVDEIDKAAESDLYVLLTLMESGVITRLQHRAIEEERRTVWVFAAANDASQLPQALASRFVRLDLRAYSLEETRQITERVLIKREGIRPARAREIARKTAERSRDPRDAIQVARLTPHGEPIDPVLDQVAPASKNRSGGVS
jgi:holliday junction DNA helicase RuvB